MVDGLVVVDKPAGWTSHDVVGRCRRIFGQKRVGHSGTLDPDATGVLLVGLGRVTRLLRFLNDLPKTYVGEVVLGVATTTLDAAGDVTGEWDMSAVTLDAARLAAAALTGEIEQVPPMVSAVQVGGKRLHELARKGIEVERAPRPVTVHRFEVSGVVPVLEVEVECSTGTYVRVLAADLGLALGGGAYLRNLRRTAIGPFSVADAVPIDEVGEGHVLPAAVALGHLPSVTADGDAVVAIGHGKRVELGAGDEPTAVLGPDGRLVAVLEDGRPSVVLA